MREMIRLAEAVRRLGIPYQNAHRLVLTGILKGEKRGGRWWVLKTSVDDLAHSKHGGLPHHFTFGPASGRRRRIVERNRRARLWSEPVQLRLTYASEQATNDRSLITQ